MATPGFDMSECLTRVRAGDPSAAGELVGELLPLVRKIVSANLPWQVSPDDLSQEIFVKVFSRLDQFAGGVPLEHWVARVAVNTCRDHFRRAARNREIHWSDLPAEQSELLENLAHDSVDEHAAATQLAARELADRLMESLSPEDRVVITMLDLEHRSAAEVKEVTGWSITAIRVRAFRARRRLRKELARLQPEVRE